MSIGRHKMERGRLDGSVCQTTSGVEMMKSHRFVLDKCDGSKLAVPPQFTDKAGYHFADFVCQEFLSLARGSDLSVRGMLP